jgi:hypothetical protein
MLAVKGGFSFKHDVKVSLQACNKPAGIFGFCCCVNGVTEVISLLLDLDDRKLFFWY